MADGGFEGVDGGGDFGEGHAGGEGDFGGDEEFVGAEVLGADVDEAFGVG